MKNYLLKALVTLPLWTGLTASLAFADMKVENSLRLKIENVETAVQQKIYTGGSVAFRSFYVPAQINVKDIIQKDSLGNDVTKTEIEAIANKTEKAIIFIPDVAQGQLAIDDMKIYLRDLASHMAPFVGKRDIYIFPGRVVEGSYIHRCGLIIQQSWKSEFTEWAQTKQGVELCLKQLEQFDFDISDFSTADLAEDLALLIKEEKLKSPIIWSLGKQYEVANGAALQMGEKIGGLVIDSPYLDGGDIDVSLTEYLQTIDELAQDSQRGWNAKKLPSAYIEEMLISNNKGSVYQGDISDIGFNEDVNRLFPVNGDSLNFYVMAKADQPSFLTHLAQGDSQNIYNQFGAFALENYSSINYLPELYRGCPNIMAQTELTQDSLLKDSFNREQKRQKSICEALNASTEKANKQVLASHKIKTPTVIITGRLDPYYAKESLEAWRNENYEASVVLEYTDGSLGTPECSGQGRRDMASLAQQALSAEIPENRRITCGWVFDMPPLDNKE